MLRASERNFHGGASVCVLEDHMSVWRWGHFRKIGVHGEAVAPGLPRWAAQGLTFLSPLKWDKREGDFFFKSLHLLGSLGDVCFDEISGLISKNKEVPTVCKAPKPARSLTPREIYLLFIQNILKSLLQRQRRDWVISRKRQHHVWRART